MTDAEIEAIAVRLADILEHRLADKQSTFWLTREEYARQNKIGLRTLATWLAEGRLETKKVGRRILVANMVPSWQASDTNKTEAGAGGGSGTIGKRRRNQSGLAI